MMNSILQTTYKNIKDEIAEAALKAGRKTEEITLLAVSKKIADVDIQPILEAGQKDFGENRVQEAHQKWPPLQSLQPQAINLHLIGPLQTNKVAQALQIFNAIHTVDRISLALQLQIMQEKLKRNPLLFIQVNTGYEPQKAGIIPEKFADFFHQCRDDYGLKISGLMCIPPQNQDPVPHFKLLASLAHKYDFANLSMGMSHDFKAAIACGATHIRLGTAIFGVRA